MNLRTLVTFLFAVGVMATLLLITVHLSHVPNMSVVSGSVPVTNRAHFKHVPNMSYMSQWTREGRIHTRLPAKDTRRRQGEETKSSSCVASKKFVFIRTHKTGSTTTINIFQRYAIYNKLNVLMPVGQGWLSWPFPPEENEYVHMPDEKYDTLVHHFVYNKTWLLSKFPPETKYISILRQPFSHLKSQINYHHLPMVLGIQDKTNPIKKFLQNPWQYRNRSETFFPHVNITWDGTRNPMTFDMGWPAERADEEEEARKYISKLDSDFTIVMILEHLDESVVLLRRLMCWELRDVLFYSKSKNSRGYPYKTYVATPEEQGNHRRWSAVDYMLYNTFNNSLWQKIHAQGPDFYNELKYFRRIKIDVSDFCERAMKGRHVDKQAMVITESKWNPEFEVDKTYCWYMTRPKAGA
ncbi:GAL3ST1 [Branchiostoma lanceolatum]|uniref:GAL3ST1 protein n=1 Tax=Branchiostoma lanceolatum TaxID=7740 RepID=A0A8J9ZAA9_BRALA|nr:GAL3ST1 [Branchiostoma lanceolatum]